MRALLLSAALLLATAPVCAEETKPACPTGPVLTGPFTHWMHATRVEAKAQASGAPALSVGKPVKVTLLEATRVTYKRARATPSSTPTFSGTLSLTVTDAGTYGIAAGAGLWIDVVKDGEALRSSKHAQGPDCSGIRKVVDFDLQPGTYEVRLIDNKTADVTVMVLKH